MNTIVVSIGEMSGGKRKVIINHDQTHNIDETEITTLLKKADESWHYDPARAAGLGTELFSLLNGHTNRLRELISQKLPGGDINLILDIHHDLDTLPFEMIYDNRFLSLESPIHIMRRGSENLTAVTLPDRPLRILFMACSPDNVDEKSRLSFETEEEFIYEAARALPLELRVVDSGSVAALQDELNRCVYADGKNKYDVIHISCHGAIDGELGPVLYMEDEMGYLDKVTPVKLWKALRDFPPGVLFLSACSTAHYDRLHHSDSFCQRMNQKGIPYCLGWNTPVGDTQASFFAASLYKHSAQGMSIGESIQKARIEVKNHLESWPFLRFFIDNTQPEPLIRFTSRIVPQKPREILYDYLGTHKNV
ncbi:MAG: CHAT domain-containing protein, partial [Spirochaetales bacterium]|nr:CHAT domain-containing protein [Spirochaetales bacterium]